MQIVIATKNKHKTEEISKIFTYENCKFTSLIDYEGLPDAVENGKTFLENSVIKAKYYYNFLKIPAIADDSGLVVPALNYEPGIYSSRYAGLESDYAANNKLLLKNMAKLQGEERKAFFICVIVYFDGKNLISAEGKVEGSITDQPRGENGFGYDPLFLYIEANKTFAELESSEKNRISHRSKALLKFKNKLDELIANRT